MLRFYLLIKYMSDICFFIGKILAISFILIIFGSIFLQVIMRYVFAHPLVWPEGLSKVLFIVSAYLAAGLVIKIRAHIIVNFFSNQFPAVLRSSLQYIFSITMLFLIVIFTIYSLKFGLGVKGRIYELGMLNEFWVWLLMVLAGFFMIVHMVWIICEDIYKQYFPDICSKEKSTIGN